MFKWLPLVTWTHLLFFDLLSQIHSGSCLSVDNSLALRVYGLGKHKAIACLCLPWHQDSISNRAQTLKRLQKCIESIQKLFIVFVCKIAFYLHDHVVPCHEPSQWYVTIRTKKGTYFDVNHYSTFEIENALCFHKVLVALVEVWENEESCGIINQGEYSAAVSSSPNLSQLLPPLYGNMERKFCISFIK